MLGQPYTAADSSLFFFTCVTSKTETFLLRSVVHRLLFAVKLFSAIFSFSQRCSPPMAGRRNFRLAGYLR